MLHIEVAENLLYKKVILKRLYQQKSFAGYYTYGRKGKYHPFIEQLRKSIIQKRQEQNYCRTTCNWRRVLVVIYSYSTCCRSCIHRVTAECLIKQEFLPQKTCRRSTIQEDQQKVLHPQKSRKSLKNLPSCRLSFNHKISKKGLLSIKDLKMVFYTKKTCSSSIQEIFFYSVLKVTDLRRIYYIHNRAFYPRKTCKKSSILL